MIRKTFGEAKDFYRLRVIKIEEDQEPAINWREGINYSGYSTESLINEQIQTSRIIFNLELVELDLSKVYVLSTFEKDILAGRALETVDQDLNFLTKNEFDDKYKINEDVKNDISENERNDTGSVDEPKVGSNIETVAQHQVESDESHFNNSDERSDPEPSQETDDVLEQETDDKSNEDLKLEFDSPDR